MTTNAQLTITTVKINNIDHANTNNIYTQEKKKMHTQPTLDELSSCVLLRDNNMKHLKRQWNKGVFKSVLALMESERSQLLHPDLM